MNDLLIVGCKEQIWPFTDIMQGADLAFHRYHARSRSGLSLISCKEQIWAFTDIMLGSFLRG